LAPNYRDAMRITTFHKSLLALALAFGVLAAACSSGAAEETTVTADTDADTVAAMCRTLELLSSAEVPARTLDIGEGRVRRASGACTGTGVPRPDRLRRRDRLLARIL